MQWNTGFLTNFCPARPVGAFSLDLPTFLGTSVSRNQRLFPVHAHDTRRAPLVPTLLGAVEPQHTRVSRPGDTTLGSVTSPAVPPEHACV